MSAVPENNGSKVLAGLAALIGITLIFLAFTDRKDNAITNVSEHALEQQSPQVVTKLNRPVVALKTTRGTIKIEIFKDKAPLTSANFIDLVRKGFYNGLTFHRYEPGFVIQGGDPTGSGTGGYLDPHTGKPRTINLEIGSGLSHYRAGIVAMARSCDPNSASSQFYITLAPQTFLDKQYAVFGEVTEGLPAVMQLREGDRMVSATTLPH